MNFSELDDKSSICLICGRPLPNNHLENEHHLKPKSLGGRDTIRIHRVCHSKIHSLFSERELLNTYYTVEALQGHPEMKKFIKWLRNKPPDYYTGNRRTRRRASNKKRW